MTSPVEPQLDSTARQELRARRAFLKAIAAASCAAAIGDAPRLLAEQDEKPPTPKADSCILLWMGGGMAAPETFEPEALRTVRSRQAG